MRESVRVLCYVRACVVVSKHVDRFQQFNNLHLYQLQSWLFIMLFDLLFYIRFFSLFQLGYFTSLALSYFHSRPFVLPVLLLIRTLHVVCIWWNSERERKRERNKNEREWQGRGRECGDLLNDFLSQVFAVFAMQTAQRPLK